jgi:hypothetical protein
MMIECYRPIHKQKFSQYNTISISLNEFLNFTDRRSQFDRSRLNISATEVRVYDALSIKHLPLLCHGNNKTISA